MREQESRRKTHASNTPRSIPYGVLSFFIFAGFGVLAFGLFFITQNIREPFKIQGGLSPASGFSDLSSQEQSKEALRASDTDHDTLSDYDELYTYRTSPYLKDTDSDGYDDKQEIATGHDPNCASSQNCFAVLLTGTSTALGVGAVPGPLQGILGGNTGQSIYSLGSLSIDQIKELLRSQGVTSEQLQGVDDKALLDLYQKTYADYLQKYEAANSPVPSAQAQTPPMASPNPISIDDAKLQNPETLTAEEIRELIRRAGIISEDQLRQVDDATLKQVFLKSLKAQ